MSINGTYPCDPSRQDAFEEGRASCDSEVEALKSENAALRNRLHVAEGLLRQWNIYSVAGGDANDTHRETCEFLNHKGDE